MEISIFLAKVIGLFFFISVLSIIVCYKTYLEMEEDAAKNPALMYLSGFFILIVGILLTVSHQIWSRDWRVIITIIGWLILVKGILRIFFPKIVKKLIEKKRYPWFLLAEAVSLLVGLYLMYKGFTAHSLMSFMTSMVFQV